MILWPIGVVTLALTFYAAVAAGQALREGARKLVRAYANRREAAMLAGLDDRMLADIGITRSDVRDAFSEPAWRDPTELLTARAKERRVYSRRIVRCSEPTVMSAPPLAPDAPFIRPAISRPARHAL
jgi:uncharacterized protein YjiS (DUF1127 family)